MGALLLGDCLDQPGFGVGGEGRVAHQGRAGAGQRAGHVRGQRVLDQPLPQQPLVGAVGNHEPPGTAARRHPHPRNRVAEAVDQDRAQLPLPRRRPYPGNSGTRGPGFLAVGQTEPSVRGTVEQPGAEVVLGVVQAVGEFGTHAIRERVGGDRTVVVGQVDAGSDGAGEDVVAACARAGAGDDEGGLTSLAGSRDVALVGLEAGGGSEDGRQNGRAVARLLILPPRLHPKRRPVHHSRPHHRGGPTARSGGRAGHVGGRGRQRFAGDMQGDRDGARAGRAHGEHGSRP